MSALLPCPFCGGGDIDPSGWADERGNSGPVCNSCLASADSTAAWNQRTTPTELATLRAAVVLEQDGHHIAAAAIRAMKGAPR